MRLNEAIKKVKAGVTVEVTSQSLLEDSRYPIERGTASKGMSFKQALKNAQPGDKLAWGTRTEKWHLINSENRDYNSKFSIVPEEARKLGEARTMAAVTGGGFTSGSLPWEKPTQESTSPDGAFHEASDAAALYGWTALETPAGIELHNRNGKHVVTVTFKGAKYTIGYPDGQKLTTGRGVLGKSVENLIKNYFYGQKV